MPEHLKPIWPCLRLVADGIVSWTDVSVNMSIDDVAALNDAVTFLGKERTPPEARS